MVSRHPHSWLALVAAGLIAVSDQQAGRRKLVDQRLELNGKRQASSDATCVLGTETRPHHLGEQPRHSRVIRQQRIAHPVGMSR